MFSCIKNTTLSIPTETKEVEFDGKDLVMRFRVHFVHIFVMYV